MATKRELERIQALIGRVSAIAERWQAEGEISDMERELMLDKLREVYEEVLFLDRETFAEEVAEAAAATESVSDAKPVPEVNSNVAATAIAEPVPEATATPDAKSVAEEEPALREAAETEAKPFTEPTPETAATPDAKPAIEEESVVWEASEAEEEPVVASDTELLVDEIVGEKSLIEAGPESASEPEASVEEPNAGPEAPAAPPSEPPSAPRNRATQDLIRTLYGDMPLQGGARQPRPEPEKSPELQPAGKTTLFSEPVAPPQDTSLTPIETPSQTPPPAPRAFAPENGNGKVLGEVLGSPASAFNEVLGQQRTHEDVASRLRAGSVSDLRRSIGLNDRFLLIRELFAGDAVAYDEAISVLDAFTDFDDAMIHIQENFNWRPDAEAALLLIDLLERKLEQR